MIIDVHGHYTTAPGELRAWRQRQIAAIGTPFNEPLDDQRRRDARDHRGRASSSSSSERGTDLTLFSPTAGGMEHHVGARDQPAVDPHRQRPHPPRLQPLPGQLHRRLPAAAVARRLARRTASRSWSAASMQQGFVGVQPQPRPDRRLLDRPADDRQLVVPAVREDGGAGRARHDPRQHAPATPTSTAPAPTTSTATPPPSCSSSCADLFKDFPTLKFVIPHGGGAVPYHWGRYRGIAQDAATPALARTLMNNVWFDTCVYHQKGIETC